ncbi:MerR family transcriptional regulator [Microbacterium sp. X-17]|uniref:transcriptional regulator FtsR n=1 Tax=Microbacterium sp. X-17 TaxID=3144404 RepID=UPI0031F4E0D0
MPAGAAAGRAAPGGVLSIGQVLARLTPEFPALTSSKLRFLEVQGIVRPRRTESGYRKFAPADLERLRLALTLQRDHYLPLVVIRDYLDQRDAGADPELPSAVPASIVPAPRRYRRDDLLVASGASPALLVEAVSVGLVPAAEVHDESALGVLRALVALERHGIEPRHLRALRQSAERDATLIESALAPLLRRPDGTSRARALDAAPELARRLDEVRAAVLRAQIARFGA